MTALALSVHSSAGDESPAARDARLAAALAGVGTAEPAPQLAPTATVLAAELGVSPARVRIALAAAYARVPRDRAPDPDPAALARELASRLGVGEHAALAALDRVEASAREERRRRRRLLARALSEPLGQPVAVVEQALGGVDAAQLAA